MPGEGEFARPDRGEESHGLRFRSQRRAGPRRAADAPRPDGPARDAGQRPPRVRHRGSRAAARAVRAAPQGRPAPRRPDAHRRREPARRDDDAGDAEEDAGGAGAGDRPARGDDRRVGADREGISDHRPVAGAQLPRHDGARRGDSARAALGRRPSSTWPGSAFRTRSASGRRTPPRWPRMRSRRLVYGDHILGRNPLGDIASVEAFTIPDLQAYYKRAFVPSVAAFHVAGAVEPRRDSQRAERHRQPLEAPATSTFPDAPPHLVGGSRRCSTSSTCPARRSRS